MRTRRPVYVHRCSPCDDVCPAGESVHQWLRLLHGGRYRDAWEILVQTTPFPAIHGRVCEGVCEGACSRAELDGALQIRAAERFLGDLAIERDWPFAAVEETTGKRALVVGAGAAGLSAAYHLVRAGHEVTVLEASAQAGGLMRYGIPAYELPRWVLDAEVSRIEHLGVTITCGRRVDEVLEEREAGGYDVVFLGLGAGDAVAADLPVSEGAAVWDALQWLHLAEDGVAPKAGRRAAVWGHGRTALAASRVLLRHGVEEVTLVCRCTEQQISAPSAQVKAARTEGIQLCCETELRAMVAGGLCLQDRDGGDAYTLPMDSLVVALGRHPSERVGQSVAGIHLREDGTLVTDERMMSGYPGIYLGGDLVSGVHSVADAVGHGRAAAFHMDLYLRETSWAPTPHPEVATLDRLNLWYLDATPPERSAITEPGLGGMSMDELVQGLTAEQAQNEAGRCLSCGACSSCDGCYAACPESAVVQLGPGRRYRFDYDLCTGCAICRDQCPTGAIAMIEEPRRHATT